MFKTQGPEVSRSLLEIFLHFCPLNKSDIQGYFEIDLQISSSSQEGVSSTKTQGPEAMSLFQPPPNLCQLNKSDKCVYKYEMIDKESELLFSFWYCSTLPFHLNYLVGMGHSRLKSASLINLGSIKMLYDSVTRF